MFNFECEQCEVEMNQGEEVLHYDSTYFCSKDCVKDYIMDMEENEICEVVLP